MWPHLSVLCFPFWRKPQTHSSSGSPLVPECWAPGDSGFCALTGLAFVLGAEGWLGGSVKAALEFAQGARWGGVGWSHQRVCLCSGDSHPASLLLLALWSGQHVAISAWRSDGSMWFDVISTEELVQRTHRVCRAHRRPPSMLWLVGLLESERRRRTVLGRKHVAGGCSPLRRGTSLLLQSIQNLEFIKSRLSIPVSPSEKKELAMNGAVALLWQFTCSPCSIVPADT